MNKKNIKFFLMGAFCFVCLFFVVNSVSAAVEYTAACPENATIGSTCAVDGGVGKCQLKSVNGRATKTCVPEVEAQKVGDTTEKNDNPSVKEEKTGPGNDSPATEEKTDPANGSQGKLNLDKPTFNGIVPCGTDETGPCTLCHLIVGIQRLFKYGLYLVTTLAFVGLFIGGAMYMISTGDTGMMDLAKAFIRASLIGFALVLGAWLLVNIILNILPTRSDLWSSLQKTNWYTFSCSTTSSGGMADNNDNKKEGERCGKENMGICRTLAEWDYNKANFVPIDSGRACSEEDSKAGKCIYCDAEKNHICVTEKNTKVACGDGGRGVCLGKKDGVAAYTCPDKYVALDGGKSCSSGSLKEDGITKCCMLESDTIKKDADGKKYYSCGAGAAGICTVGLRLTPFSGLTCPTGWKRLSGGSSCGTKGLAQTATSITVCCTKE